jgi:beta-lactamase class A
VPLTILIVLLIVGAVVIWSNSRPDSGVPGQTVANSTARDAMPETETEQGQSQLLQQALDAWIADHPQGYRVVVRTVDGEQISASYKPDVVTVPASTYKLFVAYAAYYQAEQGKVSLSHTLESGLTVEQCIEKAIVRSDNACAEAVGYYVGWEAVDRLIRQAGFSQTTLNNYAADGGYNGDKQSTAADLAALLQKLYDGTLLTRRHTDVLLGYMKQQVYRSGIPAGSPGATVADKVGFLPGLTHDAAIVYGKQSTYVLVVLSEETENWSNIRSLAAAMYDQLK